MVVFLGPNCDEISLIEFVNMLNLMVLAMFSPQQGRREGRVPIRAASPLQYHDRQVLENSSHR